VRPQAMPGVLDEIADSNKEDTLVMSIAAGLTTSL